MGNNRKFWGVTAIIVFAIAVVYFHDSFITPETKVEQFKEDYFRYNDSYRDLIFNIKAAEIQRELYIISWSYKLNEATFTDASGNEIIIESKELTRKVTDEMRRDIERITVHSDSFLVIEFKNNVNYSNILLYVGMKDLDLVDHFKNETRYQKSYYPHQFESNWIYILSSDVILYKE